MFTWDFSLEGLTEGYTAGSHLGVQKSVSFITLTGLRFSENLGVTNSSSCLLFRIGKLQRGRVFAPEHVCYFNA